MTSVAAEPARLRPDARSRLALIAPFDSKLRIPEFRAGLVRRPDRVAALAESTARVVSVSAPAGYGKTTLLAEWAESDPRRFAWLSITETDNSPVVLLCYLVRALDRIEPVDDVSLAALTRSDADFGNALLPRFAAVLEERTVPAVLVLDDVHLLQGPGGRAVLSSLIAHVPLGWRVVLGGRGDGPAPLSRLRVGRDLIDVGPDDLALSLTESDELVRASGLRLSSDAVVSLVERTEGWPAGLYLAALSLRANGEPSAAAHTFAGDDRLVAEFLRDELLGSLAPPIVEFLVRTSVLEALSGPLCDAILGTTGSTETLDDIAAANLFLVPLDERGEWYRPHHLFRDLLLDELRRRESDLEPVLHARASAWFEAVDLDAAIRHARAAGDVTRAAGLIWSNAPVYLGSGRSVVIGQWLALFRPEEIAAVPELALAAALRAMTSRQVDLFDHYVSVVGRAPLDATLADGRSIAWATAILRAAAGKDGLARMATDAATAYSLDHPGSPFRPLAHFLDGSAHYLSGHRDAAHGRFEEAIREAGAAMATSRALAWAGLALLDIDAGTWGEAEREVATARGIARDFELRDQPPQSLVYALSALISARAGDSERARRDWDQARELVSYLTNTAAWLAGTVSLVLARTSLLLGEVTAARQVAREAQSAVARMVEPGVLADRLAEVLEMLDEAAVPAGVTVTPLTAAEIRVLRYLPTHLSLAAIAENLFVSRNTVKTHAISVYRKLAVSSRPDAVARARELGLLERERSGTEG